MRRPSTVQLALMGGGVVLTLGGGIALLSRDSAACRQARAENSPDVEVLCRSSSGSSSGSSRSHGGFFSSRSGSSSSSASSSVSRGGFGSAGAAAHGGS